VSSLVRHIIVALATDLLLRSITGGNQNRGNSVEPAEKVTGGCGFATDHKEEIL